jgi:hypothetical protein
MPVLKRADIISGQSPVAAMLEYRCRAAAENVKPSHQQGNNGAYCDTLRYVPCPRGDDNAKHGAHIIVRYGGAAVRVES